jgi:hypothetical protein
MNPLEIRINFQIIKIVQALGGQMATDPKENTHLIANKIIKSCKFLSSVNRGIPVITERWLDESIRARMFLSSYFLIIFLLSSYKAFYYLKI